MSVNLPQYPAQVWDGKATRIDRNVDRAPSFEDWDTLVAEVIAVQSAVALAAKFNYNVPIDEVFFVTDKPVKVRAIIARPQVAGTDASAVTAQVRKVPSGTAPASGTLLHTGTINLKGAVDTNQALTLSATPADIELAAGDSLALDVTGVTTAARGNVTVILVPR